MNRAIEKHQAFCKLETSQEESKPLSRFYSEKEMNRFLSVVDNTQFQLLVLLMFTYGLSVDECLGLRWSNFQKHDLRVLRSERRKNNQAGEKNLEKQVFIYPLTKKVRDSLKVARPRNVKRHTLLFSSSQKDLSIFTEPTIRHLCLCYARKAELPLLNPDEYWTSSARNLLLHGISTGLVAWWVNRDELSVKKLLNQLKEKRGSETRCW